MPETKDVSLFDQADVGREGVSQASEEDFNVSSHYSAADAQPAEISQELAEKETRAVNRLKIVLFFILLFSAAGVATLIYVYTSGDETDEFQESFTEFSNLILDIPSKPTPRIDSRQ
jgi:hypothetical protein